MLPQEEKHEREDEAETYGESERDDRHVQGKCFRVDITLLDSTRHGSAQVAVRCAYLVNPITHPLFSTSRTPQVEVFIAYAPIALKRSRCGHP